MFARNGSYEGNIRRLRFQNVLSCYQTNEKKSCRYISSIQSLNCQISTWTWSTKIPTHRFGKGTVVASRGKQTYKTGAYPNTTFAILCPWIDLLRAENDGYKSCFFWKPSLLRSIQPQATTSNNSQTIRIDPFFKTWNFTCPLQAMYPAGPRGR